MKAAGLKPHDGFVNVTVPAELDRYIDALVAKGIGDFHFARKKDAWQAAVRNWLTTRPDVRFGVKYLQSQATKSRYGSTSFVQRRIELGYKLEDAVRALSAELSDVRGRPLPLARIIYTALDHYARYIATPAAAFGIHQQKPYSSSDEDDNNTDEPPIMLHLNTTGVDATRIIRFIESTVNKQVSTALTVTLDRQQARTILTAILGKKKVDDAMLVTELTRQLAVLGR